MTTALAPSPSRRPTNLPNLPSRPRLTRVPVLATDPPFDDELPPGALPTEGALALALPLGGPARRALALVPPHAAARVRRQPSPPRDERVQTPRSALPDPRPRAVALVRVLLEVLGGERPSRHLSSATSLQVLESVERRCRAGRRTWARSLRSVRVSEVVPGVAEVTAVVDRGARCEAMALRLEGLDGRWMVTALELG